MPVKVQQRVFLLIKQLNNVLIIFKPICLWVSYAFIEEESTGNDKFKENPRRKSCPGVMP